MPNPTVSFREVTRAAQSPRIRMTSSSAEVERTFLVDWDDVKQFCEEAIGYAYVDSGGLLRRWLPMPDPVWDWMPATEIVDVIPKASTGEKVDVNDDFDELDAQSIGVYKSAFVVVKFSTVDYRVFIPDEEIDSAESYPVDDPRHNGEFYRFTTFKAESSADYATLSSPQGTSFKWAEVGPGSANSVGNRIIDTPPLPLPASTFTYAWRDVPAKYVPIKNISDCLGAMNADYFDGAAPWTMILQSYDEETTVLANGTSAEIVRFVFKYNPRRWDRIPDPTSTPLTFVQISTDGNLYNPGDTVPDGTLLFNVRDFNVITQPDS